MSNRERRNWNRGFFASAFAIALLMAGAPGVIGLGGCTTTGAGGQSAAPTLTTGAIEKAVTIGTAAVIRNNPKYQPIIGDLRDRIDVLLARGYTSPALITQFLAELTAKYQLTGTQAQDIAKMIEAFRLLFPELNGYDFPLQFATDEKAKAFLVRVKAELSAAAGLAVLFPKSTIQLELQRDGTFEPAETIVVPL